MKKKPFAAVFISALLTSALAGALLINVGTANPMVWPTTVTLLSPENKTYAQNTIPVAFNYSAQGEEASFFRREPNPYYKYILDGNTSALLLADFDGSVNHANLTGVPDGAHTLIIHLMANYGNPTGWDVMWYGGYSNAAVFIVDTTPPSIEILSPGPMAYNASDVQLSFTVNESSSRVAYSLDGQDNVTASGNMTLAGLLGGAHNVTVYAWDAVGNFGASETRYFMVAQEEEAARPPEPFPTTLIAASVIVTVAIAGAGLLLYLRKRKQ